MSNGWVVSWYYNCYSYRSWRKEGNENKQNYFNDLSYYENEERIIKMIENNKDEEFKKEMKRKVIDEHYKKR